MTTKPTAGADALPMYVRRECCTNAPGGHRRFRPEGWVEAGREKLDLMRPLAEAAGLSPIQLACRWNLTHDAV